MPSSYLQDLKLRLLASGISVDEGASASWFELFGGPLTLAEYASTSGIALSLPGELYVNAPLVNHPSHATPTLRFCGEFFVADQSREVPVRVIPVPAYHHLSYQDHDGAFPYTNLGVTHTDRCRISPIEGCAWRCTFCDLPYEFRYRKKPIPRLVEVIGLAAEDPLTPANHVLISGGTPRVEDEAWLDAVYQTVARHSPLPVDVMMPPRADTAFPEWLRSVGVNLLSVNMEVSDETRARRIIPHKYKQFGRTGYLDYVEAAVAAFGVGFVQSLLVFGDAIEPLESTLKGVRDLVDRGCIPVLSPFRSHHLTPLRGLAGPTTEEMRRIYDATLEICVKTRTGVLPGPRCIPCQHNTVAFPIECDFYVAQGKDVRPP
jgi:Radical SAM superfamily